MLRFGFLFFAVLIQVALALPADAAKRVALVIGNAAYSQAGTLTNPVNDTTDMANALKKFGFEVILGLDLDRRSFDEKIRAFSNAVEDADAAVLFYAGHGLQVAGHNYLVPVDAGLSSERDLDFEAISLDFVLKQMEVGREGKTNIVFLDACRDNPLARNLARSMGTRSAAVGRGLAEAQTGVGTFIAYSTQPGNVALDGAGRNSPFTAALSSRVQEKGIEVRKDVLKATGGRQVPWDHSALTNDFFFQSVAGQSQRSAGTAEAESQPRQLIDDNPIAVLDALAAAQSWSAAHVVGIGLNRKVSSLYYALGLDAPGGEAICSDKELQYDIIVGLQLPSDYRDAKAARAVAERCWDAVKGVVIDNAAKETPSSYYAGNACPILIKHDALGDVPNGKCQESHSPNAQ